jgi:crotonobetainyl-CoA:carnitine CoA-transferase CaiB-like acyl-CoA transferase
MTFSSLLPTYIAVTGALLCIGRPAEPPVPLLNLVRYFGGGMLPAFGVVCDASVRGSAAGASSAARGAA